MADVEMGLSMALKNNKMLFGFAIAFTVEMKICNIVFG
jgi:hypothetical protein